MENEYFPAIITATAGIVGIVLNVLVNTYYRSTDMRLERKNQIIQALDTYYIPLRNMLEKVTETIHSLENQKKIPIDVNLLIEWFNNDTKVLAEQKSTVSRLKSQLLDIQKMMGDGKSCNIYNYKIRRYCDRLNLVVQGLCPSDSNKKALLDFNYDLTDILRLIMLIEKTTISVNAKNYIHYLYLKLWARYTK